MDINSVVITVTATTLLANLVVLGLMLKLYTEIFKEQSQRDRTRKVNNQ